MDVALVGVIVGFIAGGWRTGFVERLIGLGFIALSFVASAYLRYPIGAIAGTFFKDIPTDYANLVGYSLAFPVILAGLHVARRAVFGRVSVHGVSKEVDKGLGAVFGGIEAILIISVAVVIVDAYFGTSSTLTTSIGPTTVRSLVAALNASTTVHLLRDTTIPVVLAILGPLLPKDITTLLPIGPSAVPGGFPIPSP
jgi:uncharacterized membrane protein required for colicin V production